jgi:acetyl-CoA carboxylase biotin carboxyl carrier protein
MTKPVKKKPTAPAAKAKPVTESGELSLIRKLAEILNETGLTEIELDHKGAKVRVSRTIHAAATVAAPVQNYAPAPVAQANAPMVAASTKVEITGTPLKSPMVGTAYLSATPGGPPFAELGSMVKEGQTLLIIEAMKTMNQITAPRAGKLVQVNIANAQAVEFGEVLLVIE